MSRETRRFNLKWSKSKKGYSNSELNWKRRAEKRRKRQLQQRSLTTLDQIEAE